MSTALALATPQANLMKFSKEENQLIRNQLFPRELSEAHFKVYIAFCQRKRLDPIQRQVHAVARRDNARNEMVMAIQTSIDGYRALAARTGQYAGQDDAIFDNELQPKKASVTVYRIIGGHKCAFTGSARWDEFYPGERLGFQWRKMPHVMLGKCAEAQALRKGFPEDLSGIYTDDEMAAGNAELFPVEAKPVPKSTTTEDAKALDAEYSQVIADTSEQPTEPVDAKGYTPKTLEGRRVAAFNSLIGKGKPFGNKAGEAKKWVLEFTGSDVMGLNESQCQAVEEAIQKGIVFGGGK